MEKCQRILLPIHICMYVVVMWSNSVKVIKIDRNMPLLWQIVYRNIVLTVIHVCLNAELFIDTGNA
jgi:hypothetical protein